MPASSTTGGVLNSHTTRLSDRQATSVRSASTRAGPSEVSGSRERADPSLAERDRRDELRTGHRQWRSATGRKIDSDGARAAVVCDERKRSV